MIDQAQTDRLLDFVGTDKKILVIFPKQANVDLFLASYCLFIFMNEVGQARLLSPQFKAKPLQSLASLVQQEKVELELGKDNLLISFPYQEEQVDKVSYHIGEADQRFYLTIKPKIGSKPLDSKQVEFVYAGTAADLILTCGVDDLEELEQLYVGYENLYQQQNTRVVTLHDFIPDFGTLNLDISGYSSYSEAVFVLLQQLDSSLDLDLLAKSELPTLLLYGIDEATQGLSAPELQAHTFAHVAALLNLGASRLFVQSSQVKSPKKSSSSKFPKSSKTNNTGLASRTGVIK